MSTFHADSKVLIVGAGPGGLALAQILRANAVPFQVFEREINPDERRQGWTFGLVEALHELPPLLPTDLGDIQQTSVNHSTGDLDVMTIIDAKTAARMAVMGGQPAGQPGHIVRGVRGRLRNYLSQHIDIQVGKDFSHYEEHHDRIVVHFKDGSLAEGDILVAADGAHSKIRAQLLNDEDGDTVKITLSEWIPIFGECRLPREAYEPLHKFASAGVMAGTDKVRFQVSPRSLAPDRSSAEYYWSVVSLRDDPHAYSDWVQHASGDDLHRRALEITESFPVFMTDVIRQTGSDGMVTAPPKFVEFVPPKVLPRGRVTLLGDAAHTMIPFKGAGANTAIQDACDLARVLVRSAKGAMFSSSPSPSSSSSSSSLCSPIGIDWALREYERVMLHRGRSMVLASRASGKNAASILEATKGRVFTKDGMGGPKTLLKNV